MITVIRRQEPGGTSTQTVTYCERRGLLEFRRGGRKIDSAFVEKHLSRPDATQIAIRILSE